MNDETVQRALLLVGEFLLETVLPIVSSSILSWIKNKLSSIGSGEKTP